MDRRVNSSGLSDCSELEEIQKLEPVAKVVKAFNTIFAELLPTKPHRPLPSSVWGYQEHLIASYV